MRPTTVLKAAQLQGAVAYANQWHPLWRAEHFANGEHNSRLVPVTVVEVDSAGNVIAQRSVKAAGVIYSATTSRVALGRYLITLDAGITVEGAHAAPFNSTSCTAEVDVISTNTVQVRTYTVNSSGTFTAADMEFACAISAPRFDDTVLAALTTAFTVGGFPVASSLLQIVNQQNAIWDLLQGRHSQRGVHTDIRDPLAVGRVSYTGGNYVLQPGSSGIVGVSKVATGRCQIDFGPTAATKWFVKAVPIGVAAYMYQSFASTQSAIIENFSTATKPTYALNDGPFYVSGWAL